MTSLKIDPTRLTKAINEVAKYRHSQADVRRFLKDECGMLPQKNQRYRIPTGYPAIMDDDEIEVNYEDACGRPYEFIRDEWIEEEEEKEREPEKESHVCHNSIPQSENEHCQPVREALKSDKL